MEPWGLAGDRRWVLIDDGGKVVTQRQQPRLALAAAEPLPGGGVRLSAPGPRAADRARCPSRPGTVPLEIFGDKVEAVPRRRRPRTPGAARYLGADVRLVHMDDPAHAPPRRPGVRAARRDRRASPTAIRCSLTTHAPRSTPSTP